MGLQDTAVGCHEFSVAVRLGDNSWDVAGKAVEVDAGERDVPDHTEAAEKVWGIREVEVLEVGRSKLEVDPGIGGGGPSLGPELAAPQAGMRIPVGGEEFGDAGGGLEKEAFVLLGGEGG